MQNIFRTALNIAFFPKKLLARGITPDLFGNIKIFSAYVMLDAFFA